MLFQYSGDKYCVRVPIFGHIFCRSENVPKNMALDQESLISHVGTVTPPKNKTKNEKKQRKAILLKHQEIHSGFLL